MFGISKYQHKQTVVFQKAVVICGHVSRQVDVKSTLLVHVRH